MNFADTITPYIFKGKTLGPSMLVFGAVHGNEKCGTKAIENIIEKFKTGELSLLSGTLTLIPICNPQAYIENKRHIDENLNRVFKKTESPITYESHLANLLCNYADEADILIDLHSTFAEGPVNVLVDYVTPESTLLAEAIGADYIIYGWPDVYNDNEYKLKYFTTERYMHENSKTGVTVECGQHNDPHSIEIAEETIVKVLSCVKITQNIKDTNVSKESQHITMKKIFVKENDNDFFSREWKHLEYVPENTRIATYSSGKTIIGEKNTVIIFPKSYAAPKEEWFYLGTIEK